MSKHSSQMVDKPESTVTADGVTYMTWMHTSDTSVEKIIYSKNPKFHKIKSWNRQVFTHCWYPSDKEPTAFMLMCHGIHEHAGRYDDYMRGIVARTDICVVGVDWVGHGRSSAGTKGPDAKVPSFHMIIHDALSLVERVQQGIFPAAPQIGAAGDKTWYLFGHSMGGCVALNLLLERPDFFKCASLSAPLTDTIYGQAGTCILVPLFQCLSGITPSMKVAAAELIEAPQLMHDTNKQDVYDADNLIFKQKVRTRLMCELIQATIRLGKEAHTITTPMCFVHSTEDLVVKEAATEVFLQKLTCEEVTFEKKEGWFHEMHNEGKEGLDFMVNHYSEWILAHPPTAVTPAKTE